MIFLDIKGLQKKLKERGMPYSLRRLRQLCENKQIKGAFKIGNVWLIPNPPILHKKNRKKTYDK
jgi:hypothetical protein